MTAPRSRARLAARLPAGSDAPFDVLVCPPYTLLSPVAEALRGSRVALGAQDCHPSPSGAHTGDVGAPMLSDAGCTFVIVGHSERRTHHGETDALVAAKAAAALAEGLTPIVCVGETEEERLAGTTLAVVEAHLSASLPAGATQSVVAYEPVWAIGTGRTPTPADVEEVHAHMRRTLTASLGRDAAADIRILYGGSVKPSNAAELLGLANVDGCLVGGASLEADAFWAICRGSGMRGAAHAT